MATAADIGADYAKGQTIWLTFTGISYVGHTPTTLTGLDFIFTLLDAATRTSKVRATDGVNGLTASVVDNAVQVVVEIDTDSESYAVFTPYEFDLWAIDAVYGKQRIYT